MAQLVQLEQSIVKVFEFEVGGQQTALHVVRRVLDGAEVVDVEGIWHNDHAAGVLAGGPLYAGAADAQAVFLCTVDGTAPLFQILFHVTESGLVLQTGDGARLEHVFFAEEFLGVAVDAGLVHAGEVQVDIGLLVAVEPQECFEGDVVAFHDHGGAADRALFIRQVEAVHGMAVVDPLTVLAFGAQVMGRHAVDFGNTGKVGHSGGTDGTTAAHLVAARVGVGHQLDGNDVQNGIAMAADGIQFLLQALLQDIGNRVTVAFAGVFPGAAAQLFLGALNGRRIGAFGDGAEVAVDGGGDLVGVGDHHFVGFFLAQVAEFLQHILGGAVEQRGLVVGILEAVARLENGAVSSILRFLEMHVPRSHHRLVQFFGQGNDGAVEVLHRLNGIHLAVAHHELIVAQGLDLQHIVIVGDTQKILVTASRHNGTVEFPCFAGRGKDQTFPILVEQAAGHPGLLEEILGVSSTDDAVQVFQARLVLHPDDEVVVFLFQHLFVAAQTGIDLLNVVDFLLVQVLQHLLEDTGQGHGVIHRPVVVEGRDLQVLVDGIQLIVPQAREQCLGHGNGIDIRIIEGNTRPFRRLVQDQHIKAAGVVGNDDVIPAEFLEAADGFVGAGGVRHHGVVDAGEFHHPGGNRTARINKSAEALFLVDLAVFHVDGADLGHDIVVGIQAGGLGIKDHKAAGERHLHLTVDSGDHIVHEVGFAPVDQLEVRVGAMDVIRCQHGFGVALADTVVGDGNGTVAHAVGQTDDLAGVTEAVHGAGLGMQVQFHTLLAFGGGILAGFPLHLEHIVGQQNVVTLVLVVGIVAPHDKGGTGLETLPLGHIFPVVPQHLEVDGTVVVGDGGEVDLAAAALDLGGKNIAPDGDLAAVAQIVERAQIRRFEGLAVEQLGRLGAESQTFDGEGRNLFLGLELHSGGLFGHTALQGIGVQRRGHILHAHHRQGPGAFLDQFGQMPGEVHTFQNGTPGVDPHGQTVRFKSHRAVFIQKTVHRHPLLFQFLDEDGHGIRGDGVVIEVIAQGKFIARKHRLQRRQQAAAEPCVQRLGTAQADDDSAGSAEQFHFFHNNAAEAGAELSVGRELRPDLSDKRFQGFSFLFPGPIGKVKTGGGISVWGLFFRNCGGILRCEASTRRAPPWPPPAPERQYHPPIVPYQRKHRHKSRTVLRQTPAALR